MKVQNKPLNELKALLRYKNISYAELSKVIELSITAISDKINHKNGRNFSTSEVSALCDYLEISTEDIPKYFFAYRLA